MTPCGNPWEVCNVVTGQCEAGQLEVVSPDAGAVVRTGSGVPVLARLVHDGGTVAAARVPVNSDYDVQTLNVVFPSAQAYPAPVVARLATYKFGWDAGPREDRAVEVHGCNNVSCADWQSCTPTLQGGTCAAAVTGLQFVSPVDGGVYGPNAALQVEVLVTLADGGVLVVDVPVVGPSGPTVVTGLATVKRLSTTTPATGGPFTWRTAFDGGVNASVTAVVDATGPSFTLVPQGGPTYRRDDVVRVEVRPSETLMGTPEVSFAGSDAGVRLVASSVCGPGCSGSCECAEVDMAVPPLAGLDGGFALAAAGRDRFGNRGASAGPSLPVTRLRWTRDISLPSDTTPLQPVAVSRSGVVIAAVRDRPGSSVEGRVVALWQDGGTAWHALQTGTVTAGPVVGATDVWLGLNTGGGTPETQLQPLSLAGGLLGSRRCPDSATNAFNGDMALTTNEVVMGIRNGGIFSARSTGCDFPHPISPAPGDPMSRPALAVQMAGPNAEAYVAYEGDTRLWKASLMGTSWMGQGDVLLPAGPQQTKALFFNGMGRVGGGGGVGNGEYFMTSAVGNLTSTSSFNSLVVSNGGPASHGASALFYGSSTAGGLGRISIQGNALMDGGVVSAGVGNLQGTTPVLGSGLVYAVGASGMLTVRRQSDLSEVWSGNLVASPSAVAQPALDVYRDGSGNKVCPTGTPTTRPPLGVLYVLTRTGSGAAAVATLRAILVDSPGLDPTAPWPKYQRDNGNTGNINSDISPWTCP
jgi:hypothetical protein